ncbi:TIGR04282 family arsenosugar biosynthesis glycosyltransferase [Nonomuraea zeae]|uniref:Glycosyltransferase n=1 Tax=Nonomuraea zeae TaxID=1642303 RepID=A0A5S4EZP9_9ACTN|nr:TIGR04282 family arsenosugar biosynthesis glycosyltransferase [Nonomuraea zeae]TMR09190.1 glycosyltransferase [Nonomuraea zeae]
MTDRTQIVVLAKRPRPGRVKTRLTPPYTPEEAAALAACALDDTLDAVAATPAAARLLALDEVAGPDLTAGRPFELIGQRGDGLDERLAWAFQDAYARRRAPVVLVGMDSPQLTPALLAEATVALDDHDAVFGPATDGGFWLLGLRRPDPARLLGVPMSTPGTGAAQLRRLRGLSVAMLPRLTDVDDEASAREVAGQAPHTRFAAALSRLGAGAAR